MYTGNKQKNTDRSAVLITQTFQLMIVTQDEKPESKNVGVPPRQWLEDGRAPSSQSNVKEMDASSTGSCIDKP